MKAVCRIFVWSAAVLLVVGGVAVAQDKPQPGSEAEEALAPIEDKPGLPRVLLIGDSISMGYTLPVRKELDGVANVHRVPTNGGPTTKGLKEIDAWLGDKPWDVIHFNWGLHDLKLIEGKHQVSLERYEQNLEKLVARLEKTGAKLIWCTTTPVPEGAANRTPGDELKYNEAALRVMKKHNVEVNDLHAFAKPQLAKIQGKQNVHFSKRGSTALGKEVAGKIKAALPSDSKSP